MSVNKNCAVYTRKSSDERLEMEFNSLDAQRESCLAYITSQKAEGWKPVKKNYDDGGFSGGSMNRPALNELITDIKDGKVDIVVVYKIDRLTRSLMDFSKLVEIFDKYGVTFVSVTQSFNTTTSMGRLTLNVLLSFAQFEREVAGERIRDKISASKKKGMWMGGVLPLGYNVKDRQLVVDENGKKTVNLIFNKYLELGSINELKIYLDDNGIKSYFRVSEKGNGHGGSSYSRGALNFILSNPVYIGKIRHMKNIYDGNHDGIIPQELFDAVQTKLQSQSMTQRGESKRSSNALLKGKIFANSGDIYTPTYTNKSGKRYRYYICNENKNRLPADEVESFVERQIRDRFKSLEKTAELFSLDIINDNHVLNKIVNASADITTAKLSAVIKRVTVANDKILITIDQIVLRSIIAECLDINIDNACDSPIVELDASYKTKRVKGGALVIKSGTSSNDIYDLPPQELKRLVQGIVWRDEHFKGMTLQNIAKRESVSDSYVGKTIFLTFETI